MTSSPEQTPPAPTGPEITTSEVLRRSVPEAVMTDGGVPGRSAFLASSHDGMMSTFREAVSATEAARRWTANSKLIGVWPVQVEDCMEAEAKVYGDAGQPCGCGGKDGCSENYPDDHASVDLRPFGRSRRERIARRLRDKAVAEGALHMVPIE